jgi:molybdate transport system ATP-binding protein
MLEIRIKKSLGEFNLDISYASNSRHIGILGASGSGKSLTLKTLAGIECPDSGYIALDGRVLYDSSKGINLLPQARRVGYLFQNYALFPNMSVFENIMSGIKGGRAERRASAANIMERFGLSELKDRLPSQLSGGQQQRVALCRIIASEPDVILLDEPFAALDAYMRDEMQKSLCNMLKDFNGIVIIVSHSRDEIYTMSDELMIVDKGAVAASGATSDIFKHPPNRITARLTGCKNIASAERVGENELNIPDWGVILRLNKPIDRDITGVAIRAHDFSLEYRSGMHELDVLEPELKEELFEYMVYFKTSRSATEILCFKISSYIWDGAEDRIPGRLYMAEENLLLLKD